MSNPYQSPQPVEDLENGDPSSPLSEEGRKKLRKIARCQCLVLYALLANFGVIVCSVAFSRQEEPFLYASLAAAVVMVGVFIFSIIATILLAIALRNPIVGILGIPLMLLPCIALFALLIINQWLTNYLTDRGVKFGFLGADPKSI